MEHTSTEPDVQNGCFAKGLLVLEVGENVIRTPPPVVRTDEAETSLRLFTAAVSEIAAAR
jgi:4-aminobutyrate aminotransferase-like enzyme